MASEEASQTCLVIALTVESVAGECATGSVEASSSTAPFGQSLVGGALFDVLAASGVVHSSMMVPVEAVLFCCSLRTSSCPSQALSLASPAFASPDPAFRGFFPLHFPLGNRSMRLMRKLLFSSASGERVTDLLALNPADIRRSPVWLQTGTGESSSQESSSELKRTGDRVGRLCQSP